MADASTPEPEAQVRALYEQGEARTAEAFEELVSKPSFGVLLARSAENVAAMARIGSDFSDLVLRNLRLAGRSDVTRLARQLHRTEDKLERLLQEEEPVCRGERPFFLPWRRIEPDRDQRCKGPKQQDWSGREQGVDVRQSEDKRDHKGEDGGELHA